MANGANLLKSKAWFPRVAQVKTTDGGPPTIVHRPAAASQTILTGYPLAFSLSTGEVSVFADTDGYIYGFAMCDVTTTAADEKTDVIIAAADRRNIFEAQCTGMSSNDVELGTEYDLHIVTTAHAQTVKVEDSQTEGHVTVIERTPGDDIADDTYPGRVRFWVKRSEFDELVAAK